jgi:hypothetical protein
VALNCALRDSSAEPETEIFLEISLKIIALIRAGKKYGDIEEQ